MKLSRLKRRNVARHRSNTLRPRLEMVERRALLAGVTQPLVVATLGDSLTDEYSFYGPQSVPGLSGVASLIPLPAAIGTVGRSSAKNWVQNLAATRASQVTFGTYSSVSRGETRDQGFAEDWARSGATAVGANLDGSGTTFAQQYAGNPAQSLPGLLTQTAASSGYAPRNVNVVTILVGSNDYLHAVSDYAQSLSQTDEFAAAKGPTNPVNAGIERSIAKAVTQIHRKIPQARIVIVTPPDITIAPVIESALAAGASLFPGLGTTITRSVAALDADLGKLARQRQVGVVDTQTLFDKFRAKPTIDGVTVDLQASGQDLTDGFVGDGFHPGTILQGVLARAIVARIDALYGKPVIAPLTDADIVAYARATQPTVTLSTTVSDTAAGNQFVLRAVVAPGAGSTSIPTGTVTFETITAATATTPAAPGVILGTAPVDGSGVATLTIAASLIDITPFSAVYNGDQATDAQLSAGSSPSV